MLGIILHGRAMVRRNCKWGASVHAVGVIFCRAMDGAQCDLLNRRKFVALAATGGAARILAQPVAPARPATLDLREPLRRTVSCIMHRIDPEANYRPWFAVEVEGGRPVRLAHAVWDFGDTSGRFLEALLLARRMIPPTEEMLLCEQRVRRYLDSLIGPDGIVQNPDTGAPDHMFSQGSALYGLVTDYETGRRPELKSRIERFIARLDALARHEPDYLWFPQVATSIAPCSHMAAYQVLPIVRFYELTHYAPALRYAEHLSRWAFYHDPTVTADGIITKPGWEGHLHAWMDTFSGILRCARAGGRLDRPAVATRARKLFEWVRANYTSGFGWVADSVGSKTCETDTITSFIRLALELMQEGDGDYWNDIERFTRNQLVENQFRDVSRLGIPDARTARGLEGAFESYADPNSLIAMEKGTIEGCCINGGVRGLSLAYENAIHETAGETRLNLLLSRESAAIDVVSYIPFEGRLDLLPRAAKPLLVRCPDWLRPGSVKIDGHTGLRSVVTGHHLRIEGARPGSHIILRFHQPEECRMHVVAGKSYQALWRGDTVLEMLPRGGHYPIYQRESLRRGRGL